MVLLLLLMLMLLVLVLLLLELRVQVWLQRVQVRPVLWNATAEIGTRGASAVF